VWCVVWCKTHLLFFSPRISFLFGLGRPYIHTATITNEGAVTLSGRTIPDYPNRSAQYNKFEAPKDQKEKKPGSRFFSSFFSFFFFLFWWWPTAFNFLVFWLIFWTTHLSFSRPARGIWKKHNHIHNTHSWRGGCRVWGVDSFFAWRLPVHSPLLWQSWLLSFYTAEWYA